MSFKLQNPAGMTQAARSGQRARKGGSAAEDLWDVCHDKCRMLGVAYVVHLPVPYKVTRSLGDSRFLGLWTGRALSDYQGIMLDGTNRVVCAEAKSTITLSLDLGADGTRTPNERPTGLKPHQRQALYEAHLRGDVSVVLVTFRGALRTRMFAIPWEDCEGGRRVLRVDALHPHEVEFGSAYLQRWMRT